MEKKLTAKLRVRSYELDGYGHVNNATYLQYLEFARGEYMSQMGIPFRHDMPENVRFFVVNANLNFKNPATMDEDLEIIGKIAKVGNTSFTMKQSIYNIATGLLVLDAQITIVFVDKNDTPTRIPDFYRNIFSNYEEV